MEFTKRTLGDICDEVKGIVQTGPFGSQLHKSDYRDEGIPVVMPKNIIEDKISTEGIARIGREDVERLPQHKFQKGDIVYGRRGDIGRRALVKEEQTGWLCGTGCIKISLQNSSILESSFLYYYLGQPEIVSWIYNQAIGATMPNLNTSIIRSIPITYPSLAVQRKIASILSNYDDLIENNTRRIEILEQIAKLVYEEWFVKFRFPGHEKVKMISSELGEIPEGWEIKKLYDLIEIKKGKKAKNIISNTIQNTTPYILIDGLKTGSHLYTDDDSGVFVKKHETIMVMDGASSGKVFIGCEGFVGSTLAAIKNKNGVDIDPYSIFSFLNSNFEKIVPNNIGSAIPHANKDFILNMCIILPPKSLMSYSFTIFNKIYNLKNILISKNQNLRKTRDLLLPKLISGEIDVSDLDIRIRNEFQES